MILFSGFVYGRQNLASRQKNPLPGSRLMLGQVWSMLHPETAAVVVGVASQPIHFTLMDQMKMVRSYVTI